MIEEFYYQDDGLVKITAASAGISKLRWEKIKEEEYSQDKDSAKVIMSKGRFDHLPIISNNGQVYEYLKTTSPNNFDNIKKCLITSQDVIPLDTDIREVIRKFSAFQRTFYFLTFQKRITGLITLSNLNCRQVQIYIFSLICD